MKQRDRTNSYLRDLLFTIAALHQRNGEPPTYRLLAGTMGLPITTLFYRVEALRKRGYLQPGNNTSHGLLLTDGPGFWRTATG